MTHGLPHVPRKAVRYLALGLVLALAAGGGYAMAASNDKTITVCADKKTGVLHLKTRGRCKSSQTRVSWNQQGPQGVQGYQGRLVRRGRRVRRDRRVPRGQVGVTIWAQIANSGAVFAGHGISAQRLFAGTYQVTITDPTALEATTRRSSTVSDGNPPNGQGAGAFPEAW